MASSQHDQSTRQSVLYNVASADTRKAELLTRSTVLQTPQQDKTSCVQFHRCKCRTKPVGDVIEDKPSLAKMMVPGGGATMSAENAEDKPLTCSASMPFRFNEQHLINESEELTTAITVVSRKALLGAPLAVPESRCQAEIDHQKPRSAWRHNAQNGQPVPMNSVARVSCAGTSLVRKKKQSTASSCE